MAYCRFCQREITENESVCPHCGADLTQEEAPYLVVSAADRKEEERILRAFEEAGIPAARKEEAPEQSGETEGAILLLVPKEQEEKAKEILLKMGLLESPEEMEWREEQPVGDPPKGSRRKSAVMTVLIFLLVALAVFAVDGLIGILKPLLGMR